MAGRKEVLLVPAEQITQSILVLRGHRVILDRDLAAIYGVETRTLNQAVKRNVDRFPEDFRFQLTEDEANSSRSQFVILNNRRGRNLKWLPYAFTEHGAIQAANVLNSPRAVQMGIHVVRAFVQLRQLLVSNQELADKFAELERKVSSHDQAIVGILNTIREMVCPATTKRSIGFTELQEKK